MKESKQTQNLFTPEIINSFNYGDCWVLALILKRITGWNMVGVGVQGQSQAGGMREWCHIAVQTPTGEIVDINGIHEPEEFLYDWQVSMWRLKRGIHKVELFLCPNNEYDKKILLGQKPKYNLDYEEVEKIAYELIKLYKQHIKNQRLNRLSIFKKRGK